MSKRPFLMPRNDRRTDPVSKAGRTDELAERDGSLDLGLPQAQVNKFAHFFLLAALLAAGIAFFAMVKAFLVPLILAAINAGLFYPFYLRLLKRFGGRKAVSSFVSCAVLCLGILVPAYITTILMAGEASRLYQRFESKAHDLLDGDPAAKVQSHPFVQRLHLDRWLSQRAIERLSKNASERLLAGLNVISRETLGLITTMAITFFTMYYFFRDGPPILAKFKYFSPLADDYEDNLIQRFLSVSRATLKGTLLVAVIKGALGGLTFWAFGIQAPALWGVVMVFLSILPIVGPWLVMYPAVLFLMIDGQIWQGIVLFAIATFVVGLVDNLLEPVVIGRDAGMHELLVFFSILGGIGLFGVMGFIVGPVLAALFLTLLEIYGKEFNRQLTQIHRSPSTRQ